MSSALALLVLNILQRDSDSIKGYMKMLIAYALERKGQTLFTAEDHKWNTGPTESFGKKTLGPIRNFT